MANITAHGTVSVVISEDEMEAKLFLIPESQGERWGVMELDRLIRTHRLSPVPARDLESILERLAKTREPFNAVICRGEPPLPPVPERIAWANMPFPADIEAILEEVLREAGPPELYRMHGASGTDAVPEQLSVDPGSYGTRYAEKGTAAGRLDPARPGKDGKDIFGRLTPPPEIEAAEILFGTGLEIRKNYVVPSVTGILRIGNGWADVVPLPQPSWSIELGDGGNLFLSYAPGHSRYPRPPAETIFENAEPPPGMVLVSAAELNAALEEWSRPGAVIDP
ncbi:MAG: FapA family protein [Spirochaetaceae bacterium]|jgi:hypothetical protein|nr:FapA family protein [Spirochaetaceae bacterium]